MRPPALALVFLLAAAAAPPGRTLAAQTARPERAVLVVRQAADTVAVEWLSTTAARVEGRVVQNRAVQYDWVLERDAAGAAAGFRITLSQPGKVEHTDRVLYGVDRPGGTATGAVPFRVPAYGLLEALLARARALGGARAAVPVLLLPHGRPALAVVEWTGADSARIALDGIAVHAAVDGGGRLLRARVPAHGVTVERVRDVPRRAYAPARPYAAPEGAPYRAAEVAFRAEDGALLAGTLTLPPRRAGRRLPAVVLLHGSHGGDRNNAVDARALDPALLFRQLADTLSRRGIAVLRYDKRGRGASEGRGDTAAVPVLAADARAALRWLRRRGDVDPARVGVVGLSEGAALAALVAAEDTAVAALVSLGGPGGVGREFVRYQHRERIARDEAVPAGQRDLALIRAMAALDSAAAAGDPRVGFWLRYDALATARRVRAPALVVHGATDLIVPPEHAERLGAAFRAGGSPDVTVRVFPDVNHALLRDPSGDRRGWITLPSFRIPAEVRGAVADWLAERLR